MPQKFLDTTIIYEDNEIKTKVQRNKRKLPVHWTSKIPKRYKRNAIKPDLNRAARIASTFTIQSCVIYEGICVSEQTYIGETRRNVELRWEKHENTSKDSEPAKHLKENLCHKFSWKISFAAPENKRIRKTLEAS